MTAPGWLSEAQLQRLLNLIRGTTALPWFVAGMPWNDSRTAVYGNCDNAMNDPHGARLVTDCDVTDEWTDGEPDGSIEDRSNALLIAEGMSALPTLIAMARSALELKDQVQRLEGFLDEWKSQHGHGVCIRHKDFPKVLARAHQERDDLRSRLAAAEQERNELRVLLEDISERAEGWSQGSEAASLLDALLDIHERAREALRPDPQRGEESK